MSSDIIKVKTCTLVQNHEIKTISQANQVMWHWQKSFNWFNVHILIFHEYRLRADSRLAPSQWETSLQSNAISHWLGANLESALRLHQYHACWWPWLLAWTKQVINRYGTFYNPYIIGFLAPQPLTLLGPGTCGSNFKHGISSDMSHIKIMSTTFTQVNATEQLWW